MKVLWHSNAPWSATGYGQQTATFAPRFRAAGHDVALSCFYGLEGGKLEVDGFTCYPSDHTRFGKHWLREYAKHHGDGNPDTVQVITLMDVWPLTSLKFGLPIDATGLRMACWTPIDHYPAPPGVLEAFKHTGATPIAMSRFGETTLREHGLDPLYVPHGVETTVFRPHDGQEVRAALKLPADAFIVGMVANNMGTSPPRKAFPQVLMAFAELHRRHPDALLYLHTDMWGVHEGMNLLAAAENHGIPASAVVSTDRFQYHMGVKPELLARLYSMFDVLVNPSYGEGFGVPIVEAQACGTPVIVTDWTAMPELCGAGWKVDGDPFYDASQGTFFMYPPVSGILDALEQAYAARGDQQLRAQAREFAVQYDADRVMAEYWVPVLERLDAPREVGPLVPVNGNRQMRRRAAKAKAGV